ncbi:exosome complex component RRP42 isoform X2 [Lagopus muta]|uniref:exosome complex component RRP42 isoform X2 n=1 Tax=Lagopus muta TaxID=64668 RepID=UPI00209DA719|nr:exosome complex component RRP42 isoform X2 [Lagopus muta]
MASVVLSDAEKLYIIHGVQEDLRVDGRGCEDYRCAEVETDVVSNTSGSARVKLGHTDILVGVKAEMGTPKLEKPDEGYLEFFVDCSANATPEFEGRGGEELGTEIASTLYRIFSSEGSVDLKSLCINPREHCWVLYVDVLLLECGGNLFDAISIAVKAALFNTRIPKVRVLEDEEGSKEIELSDDPYDCIRLNVDDVPCIVTLNKRSNWCWMSGNCVYVHPRKYSSWLIHFYYEAFFPSLTYTFPLDAFLKSHHCVFFIYSLINIQSNRCSSMLKQMGIIAEFKS